MEFRLCMCVVCWSQWCIQFEFLEKYFHELIDEDEHVLYAINPKPFPDFLCCSCFAWHATVPLPMSNHHMPRFYSIRTVSLKFPVISKLPLPCHICSIKSCYCNIYFILITKLPKFISHPILIQNSWEFLQIVHLDL